MVNSENGTKDNHQWILKSSKEEVSLIVIPGLEEQDSNGVPYPLTNGRKLSRTDVSWTSKSDNRRHLSKLISPQMKQKSLWQRQINRQLQWGELLGRPSMNKMPVEALCFPIKYEISPFHLDRQGCWTAPIPARLIQEVSLTLWSWDSLTLSREAASTKPVRFRIYKWKMIELKRELDKSTNIVGNFNTPFSSTDKTDRKSARILMWTTDVNN